jgi:hypothetical protein
MPAATRHPSCYLAEWYRPDLTPPSADGLLAALETATAALSAEGNAVQLLVTVVVPTDEVVYVLFSADSREIVNAVCERAGSPAERLSADVGASISASN